MALRPSLILRMTDQTPPPLNSSGPVESRVHISVSRMFQVPRAEFRLSTIQFPLPIVITPFYFDINFSQKRMLLLISAEKTCRIFPACFQ